MTSDEFKQCLRTLKVMYGNKLNIDVALWWEYWKDKNALTFNKAIEKYSNHNNFAPCVADIAVIYNELVKEHNLQLKEWQQIFVDIVNYYPQEYVDSKALTVYKQVAITSPDDVPGSVRKARKLKEYIIAYVDDCDRNNKKYVILSQLIMVFRS